MAIMMFKTKLIFLFKNFLWDKGGGYTRLDGMWHCLQNRSFQSQKGPKMFDDTQNYCNYSKKNSMIFVLDLRFFFKFERFLWIFDSQKSFFLKQVIILPEIDWYHYQSANADPGHSAALHKDKCIFKKCQIGAYWGGWGLPTVCVGGEGEGYLLQEQWGFWGHDLFPWIGLDVYIKVKI